MSGLSEKYATADSKLAGDKGEEADEEGPLMTELELRDNAAFPPRNCNDPPLAAVLPLFGSVSKGSTAEYGGGGTSSESITERNEV